MSMTQGAAPNADPKQAPNSTDDMQPTQSHGAFEWLRSERIETLNLVIEEYRHRKTGAQHFHLVADNEENVFLVALRTVPHDSTGVAHVLEHTALCGSEHYPVRDPFFMMIRRSLNTFMNAFTSSDWTAYPFASQNRKDFNNLTDVYLDAVFFSRLHELDFAQEGHRVEFEKADDAATDLLFKGVVFNEMKGAMSSPVSTLWQTLTKYIFPTTTYHHNSGGDPEHIPDLSYDALKAFYRVHYHPSNAVFMTYGNIPAQEHQQRIEERALHRFERLDAHIEVADEKRYHAQVSIEESYALDEEGEVAAKSHIVMGWLLGRSTDLEALLRAQLLSGVLLDDSASPLRLALETTELGSAPSPLCGVEDSNREMSFVCGLEGTEAESAQAVDALVRGVLTEVAEQGVPQQRIDAVLHQLELSQREIGGDGYPYGLQLMLAGLSAAIHRGDPVALLNLDPALEKLREDVRDPDYIKRLVKECLLDNPHCVRLTLKPDTGLSERRQLAESQRLAAMKARLSDDEKAQIIERSAQLAERQQQQDDPAVLPKVGLEDVPATMKIAEGDAYQIHSMPLHFYDQGTNGLVYQQVVIELPALEPELLEALPYYTNCLTELGCAGQDYLQTQAWQSSVSGGVDAFTSVRGGYSDIQNAAGYFVLSGKALTRNHAKLAELMNETLESVRFDEFARIREIIAQLRASREQSVTGSGHALAMRAASCAMSSVAAMSHRLHGMAGIQHLKQLDDGLDATGVVEQLAEKLSRIHQKLLHAPRRYLLVAEGERYEQLEKNLSAVVGPVSVSNSQFVLPPIREAVQQLWVTSTQVNFCAKAYPAVAMSHPDAAALSVLSGFLRNGYLHRAIREQGGAYGGGAQYEPDIAAFRFFSYRDPRLSETLEDFDHSVTWLLSETHDPRLLEEAILGVVASIDKPSSPAGEAKDAYYSTLFGRSPARRMQFREQVLKVSLDDLLRVAETYLKPESASTAVITSPATHEQCGDMGMVVHKL